MAVGGLARGEVGAESFILELERAQAGFKGFGRWGVIGGHCSISRRFGWG